MAKNTNPPGMFMNGMKSLFRKRGRPTHEPNRETTLFPHLLQLGSVRDAKERPSYKPIAKNLRYFSRTPYARRAINRVKNTITQLEWEIVPIEGVEWTDELRRQAETATFCFNHPNHDDSFRTLAEQTLEDYQLGAGAIELQASGDPLRPLWMWPVDGLSIQIYAAWDEAHPNSARYYQTQGYGGVGNLGNKGIPLRNDELIYMKPNPCTENPFGTGRLEVAFEAISRQLGVSDFSGKLTSNARPSVALWLKGADDRALNTFRAYWRNEIEGQGQTPIFGGAGEDKDFDIKRLYPDGDKALYLEYQAFQIREIATAFDLSPLSLGAEADVNRSTGDVIEDREWDGAIRPDAMNLSEYLTREALHRKLGFWQLRHRFKGLDRDDELATAQIYQFYYQNNMSTPNEWREKLGWPKAETEWSDLTFADTQIAINTAAADAKAKTANSSGGGSDSSKGSSAPRAKTKVKSK